MRAVLRRLLQLAGVAGMCTAAAMFAASLRPGPAADAAGDTALPLRELTTGVPLKLMHGELPIFFFRPSPEQWQVLRILDMHVWDAAMPAYSNEIDAFVYLGLDTEAGCELKLLPAGESLLIRRSTLASRSRWPGGYAARRCQGGSYDLVGRKLRTYAFTDNGDTREAPGLRPLRVVAYGHSAFVRLHAPLSRLE